MSFGKVIVPIWIMLVVIFSNKFVVGLWVVDESVVLGFGRF